MSVKPKVANGFSWTFVYKMGAGPSTNLYSIGGDPLTQLLFFNYFFWIFFSFIRNADSDKRKEKYVVGDPLTPSITQNMQENPGFHHTFTVQYDCLGIIINALSTPCFSFDTEPAQKQLRPVHNLVIKNVRFFSRLLWRTVASWLTANASSCCCVL